MPKFISEEGVYVPSIERVALKNKSDETIINPSMEGSKYFGEEVKPGEDFIYEGLDRAAIKMIKEQEGEDAETMGTHFTESTELFELARSKGYDSVEDYVKKLGYNSDKAKAIAAKNKKKINTHSLPPKVKGKKISGGGTNQTGSGGDLMGGFGAEPTLT